MYIFFVVRRSKRLDHLILHTGILKIFCFFNNTKCYVWVLLKVPNQRYKCNRHCIQSLFTLNCRHIMENLTTVIQQGFIACFKTRTYLTCLQSQEYESLFSVFFIFLSLFSLMHTLQKSTRTLFLKI